MNTAFKVRNLRDRLAEMERDPQAYYDEAFERAERELAARRRENDSQPKKK